jgi:hypothetical protein
LIKIQCHKAYEVQLRSVITTQKYRDNEAIGHETLNQLQDQSPSDLTHDKNLTYSCLTEKKVATCCLIIQSASSEPTPNRKRSRSTPQKQARKQGNSKTPRHEWNSRGQKQTSIQLNPTLCRISTMNVPNDLLLHRSTERRGLRWRAQIPTQIQHFQTLKK